MGVSEWGKKPLESFKWRSNMTKLTFYQTSVQGVQNSLKGMREETDRPLWGPTESSRWERWWQDGCLQRRWWETTVWIYFEGKKSRFGDTLEVEYKRKRKFKKDSKVFRLSSCKNGNQFRFLNQRLLTQPLNSRERQNWKCTSEHQNTQECSSNTEPVFFPILILKHKRKARFLYF